MHERYSFGYADSRQIYGTRVYENPDGFVGPAPPYGLMILLGALAGAFFYVLAWMALNP